MYNPAQAGAKRIKKLQNLFLHNPSKRARLLSSLFNSLLFYFGERHVKEQKQWPAWVTFLPSFKACMVVTVSGVGGLDL